jgi:excisionase family DNA binding protein
MTDLRAATLYDVVRDIVRTELRGEIDRALADRVEPPTYVSAADYARARSISVSTVRNAIRDGRLPAIKVGSAVRVPVAAEIGRPVKPDATRPVSPSTRAREILARQGALIPKSDVGTNGSHAEEDRSAAAEGRVDQVAHLGRRPARVARGRAARCHEAVGLDSPAVQRAAGCGTGPGSA